MDSQHRHELQQNDLRKLTNQALPFFEQHGWKILAAVAAVTLAAVGGGIWYSVTSEAAAEAWTQFDGVLHEQNPSSSDFAGVAEKYPNSSIAAWSRLKEADALLKSGLETVFTNRAASQADLKAAQEIYEKLADGAGIVPDVRERALFGLARTQESMSAGDTEAAAKTYSRLTSEFSNSIFAGLAKKRIAALESQNSKDFYAWFSAQELKPKERPPVHPFNEPKDGDKDAVDMKDGESEGDAEKPNTTENSATPSDEKPADSKEKSEAPEESKSKPDSESKSEEKSTDKPDDAPKSESP